MSFSSMHKYVTYLLSGLGLIGLSLGDELSEPVVAAIFLAYVASAFADGPYIHKPVWGNAWNASVVALLVVQVLRSASAGPTLAMVIEFAAYLQISRLFNRRNAADYQQIAVLAFLHLIAATVLSTSLAYAMIFLGFVVAVPWMLALSHLRREIEGNYPQTRQHGGRGHAGIARVLASKRVVGPRFLLGTALLSLPLFAMTLAIFVTLPRVGRGFLTFGTTSGQSVAGFGNQVELGGFGVIRDDPTVVLRVVLLDEPIPDKRVVLRMRGTSFDHYDGKRWTRSPSQAQRLRRGSMGYFVLRRRANRHDREMKIILDHLEQPVIFLPRGTVALSIDPRIVDSARVQRHITHGLGHDIRYADADGLGLVYHAFVSRDRQEQDIVPLVNEDMRAYLQLPERHERVAELARELTAGIESPAAKAVAIEGYLRKLTYTLQQPEVRSDQRPLDVFLFEARRGHCEYFSTAMAIMLRSVGVPARNVTGLLGGRYNTYGKYYALRQGDAHSWVEVYIPNRGWRTFDPTPASRDAAGLKPNLWSDVAALVDALRTRWNTSVVGYDLRAQMDLMRRIGRLLSSSDRGGSSQIKLPEDFDWRQWLPSRTALVVVALLAVGFVVWWRRRRGDAVQVRPLSREAAQAVRVYQKLERALERHGRGRPPGSTPVEHAAYLREQGFEASDEVDRVTDQYMAARYGGRTLDPAELASLGTAVKRVASAPARPAPRTP